jgi:uncharacterized repeat protein (TIGR03803 family)
MACVGLARTRSDVMKARVVRRIFPVTFLFLGSLLPAQAQFTFNTLHSFSAISGPSSTNADGAAPTAGLVLSGSTVYGTTLGGGAFGQGTLFAVNVGGTVFTNLHDFTGGTDGAQPFTGLAFSGNTLYGTTRQGGAASNGKLFTINLDGSGFTPIYSFTASIFNVNNFTSTNADGAMPLGSLIVSGSTLYGTANGGGIFGQGTVFAVNTNGTTGFTNLHNFASVSGPSATNSEGANPEGALVLAGGRLYGTTFHGGSSGNGTVFALNANGTGFTNLHSFAGTDGAHPEAGLVLVSNRLYGTTAFGGYGTLFALNTDGSGFTNLHFFTALSQGTNSDGAMPTSALLASGNTLYGTANGGGTNGDGTVFSINLDGTGFTAIYNFSALDTNTFTTNSDGSNPYAGLILSGNTLYGTAQNGGSSGDGTVFGLSLPVLPQLTIIRSGANVILTWPTNATGFTLQSTANLVSAIWTNLSGQFAVTNPISGPQRFYRLSQ